MKCDKHSLPVSVEIDHFLREGTCRAGSKEKMQLPFLERNFPMFNLRCSYGTGDEQLVMLVNLLIILIINYDGMTLSLASFVLDQVGCGLWAFAFVFLVCPVCLHEGI